MFSFNDNSIYEENKSGTKHPFVPSSRCPSRAFYMRTSFSLALTIIQFMRRTRVERSITLSPPPVAQRVLSTCAHHSPWSLVCSKSSNWVAPEIEPTIGWLCVLRSLPWRLGSQTVEQSTTLSVSRSSSNRQREPSRSTPKYLASSRR
jgi:hypothetical protein